MSYRESSTTTRLTAVSDILAFFPPFNLFIYACTLESVIIKYIKSFVLLLWWFVLFFFSVVMGVALFTYELSANGTLNGIPLLENVAQLVISLLAALTLSTVVGTIGGATRSVFNDSIEMIEAEDDYWSGERMLSNVVLVLILFLSLVATSVYRIETDLDALRLSLAFSIALLTLYFIVYHTIYRSLVAGTSKRQIRSGEVSRAAMMKTSSGSEGLNPYLTTLYQDGDYQRSEGDRSDSS